MPNAPHTILTATTEEEWVIRQRINQMKLIETRRTIMTPLRTEDMAELVDLMRDERVSKPVYLFEQPFGMGAADRWITKSEKLHELGEGVFLAVRHTETNALIGEIHIDVWPDRKSGEYGGVVMAPLWGSGIAEEIAVAVSEWLYETVGVELLSMTTARDNTASVRVIEALGFVYLSECDCTRPDGTIRPSLYFEQTRKQWLNLKSLIQERMTRHQRYQLARDRRMKPAIPGLEVKEDGARQA